MARDIKYICDCCGREYPYHILATETDRGILVKFQEFDLCRVCTKRVVEFIKSIKINQ